MKVELTTNYTTNEWSMAKRYGQPIQLDGSVAYYYNDKLYMEEV